MTPRTLCAFSGLLLVWAFPAGAQGDRARHGLWGHLALGYGLASFASDTLAGDRRSGFDFVFDAGFTPNSQVRVGIGVDQWASRLGSGKQTWLINWIGSVYYYPLTRRTFFLHAGAGVSDYSYVHLPWAFLGSSFADTVYVSGAAWGATAGAGWDIPLRGGGTVRPRLEYSYGSPRNLHSANGTVVATGWRQHWLSLDVGLVFHPADSW